MSGGTGPSGTSLLGQPIPAAAPTRSRPVEDVLAGLARRYPPRRGEERRAAEPTREQVVERLLVAPFVLSNPESQRVRARGLHRVLDWLQAQPGQTWQERWSASGAELDPRVDWRQTATVWLKQAGVVAPAATRTHITLSGGLVLLICGDVLRPSLTWLMTARTLRDLAVELARTRDTLGFAALRSCCAADPTGTDTQTAALRQIAVLMAAKGGPVRAITVGDCLELHNLATAGTIHQSRSPYFYQLLHAAGVFPADAPPTVRVFRTPGQHSTEDLIDCYGITCRPVRDLLVDYLRERQLAVDYATLRGIAHTLGRLFWRDLELHHPGIDSLRLPPDVTADWKQRLLTKAVNTKTAAGPLVQTRQRRSETLNHLTRVRAFYLDLALWAADDPARWGPWAVPSPIRAQELSRRKHTSGRKSRMDQRTRERLPVLPVLTAAVDRARRESRRRLDAAALTAPGGSFTIDGQTLHRPLMSTKNSARIWVQDPATGRRRDLSLEEHRTFWAWAVVELLRHTGIRIEELTELSHHSFVQYTAPATGELIPLLHITPSKTDAERLLVISPELADVLAAVICRIRDTTGAVPLVVAYDPHEKIWNPPMPLLLQRRLRMENRPLTVASVRELLNIALEGTGLTDDTGHKLSFRPHDFRRIFITDAILNGLPPHITQLVVGHRDINTTMGYKAVYPEEVITGHRAFIARRRALRPSEEYRTPTDTEWEEFLGHFERRKVALGTCGRSYSTPCIHEHSCIRCPLLRTDPAQRHRLVDIRDNLLARITEADSQGWLGEADGLRVSLSAARQKLTQLDEQLTRHTDIQLGIPAVPKPRAADPGPTHGGRPGSAES
jgi:hypothetical protein